MTEESAVVQEAEIVEPVTWTLIDAGNPEHVEHFRRLYLPIIEATTFSLPGITAGMLEAPLHMQNSYCYFTHEGENFLGLACFFQINWIDRSAELGVSFDLEAQGHGAVNRTYHTAIEQAQRLGLRRLYMRVLDNSPGHRAARNAPLLQHEGTLKGARRHPTGAGYRDAHLYAWTEEAALPPEEE